VTAASNVGAGGAVEGGGAGAVSSGLARPAVVGSGAVRPPEEHAATKIATATRAHRRTSQR
jgi:hypothetical protein